MNRRTIPKNPRVYAASAVCLFFAEADLVPYGKELKPIPLQKSVFVARRNIMLGFVHNDSAKAKQVGCEQLGSPSHGEQREACGSKEMDVVSTNLPRASTRRGIYIRGIENARLLHHSFKCWIRKQGTLRTITLAS